VDWLDEEIRDGLLLEAVARGDAEAAELFFTAHGEALYGALLTLFPNPYDSAEALRRVVLIAIERAGGFPADGSREASNWLLGIVAEVAGVGQSRLDGLRETAPGELRDLAGRRPLGAEAASNTAHHIRPLGGHGGDGLIVARGTAAQVKQLPQGNLLQMAARAIAKLNEDFATWREREDRGPSFADDTAAGLVDELPDPKLTPTIARDSSTLPIPGDPDAPRLPMPAETPGTMRIRAPGRTPSTETLHIVRRPQGRDS
jgi:hypothetical protein